MSISAITGSSAPDPSIQTQTQTQTQAVPHHRHGPSFADTASLLGISTGTLSSDLQSGDTLSSLASSAGVSSSDLLSAVEQDMSTNAPSGASALSGDQLSQMATNIINGVQPAAPSDSSTAATPVASPDAGAVSNAQVSEALDNVFA